MAKQKQREQNTTIYIQRRREHVSISLSVLSRKGERSSCTNLSKVRLYGAVVKPHDFKFKNAVVYVSPHEGMEVGGEASDLGWARTQDDNILLYVFWPDNLFQALSALACSGRISLIRASISSILRGNATVHGLDFETQTQADHDEEFDYWFMAKPRKKKEQ